MIRVLPFAVEAVILVFCLIDVALADDARVRNLPKWGWILLIILIPLAGGIAWLIGGRPVNSPPRDASRPSPTAGRPEAPRPAPRRPRAPDDDPEFLASLKTSNSDHERMLKQWEEDLRRREEDLRKHGDPSANPDPDPKPDPDGT